MRKHKAFKTQDSQKRTMQTGCTGCAWVTAREKEILEQDPSISQHSPVSPFWQQYYCLINDSVYGGRNKVWWQLCMCHRAGYMGVWGGGSPAPVCTVWQRGSPQWAVAPPKFVLDPCQPYPALPETDLMRMWGAYQKYSSPHKSSRKSQ